MRHLSAVMVGLIFANLGALYFYLVHEFTLFQLVAMYWWECVWIGFFSALKLLVASLIAKPYDTKNVGVSPGASLILSIVGLFFFGGKFIGFLSITALAIVVGISEFTGSDVHDVLLDSTKAIILSSTALVLGHAISFVVDFLIRGEYRTVRPMTLLYWPYVKCLSLLIAIVATFAVIANYPAAASLTSVSVLIVGFKLGADLLIYRTERRRFSQHM